MRAVRSVAVWAAALTFLAVAVPPPLRAQAGLQLTTAYPSVVVHPGSTASFDLTVHAPGRQRVELRVAPVPRGWDAVLRGGGFVIDGVFTDPEEPPEVRLDVDVPARAEPGRYRVVVTGRSPAGSARLPLLLRVARGGGEGSVRLETGSPQVRGASDATFTIDVELVNDTPQETTFELGAVGPPGWLVEARPSGEEQATSVTVEGGETATVQIEADPPDDTEAGVYPLAVQASGGGNRAEARLAVEITGNFALTLTTADERLNVDVSAGRGTEIPLVLVNEGTAPLADVTLEADPPSDWEVAFEPASIAQLEPGTRRQVVATVTPSSDAVVGDYLVTVRARTDPVTEEVDLRASVKTSGLWGLVAVLVIAAAVGGLAWVFRTYGRR
jgi:uncharacterized membrane protein